MSNFQTSTRVAWGGVALLALLCLGALGWRAGRLCGPGPEEIRALLLAGQRPAEAVVDAPLVGQFPAGYPLALRSWERLGRALGISEALAWSRLPGMAAWAAMIAAAGLLGRAAAGPGAGAALVAALAICGQGTFAARRLDGAALAGPALAMGLLCLLALYRLERLRRIGFIKAAILWSVYALAGAAAAGSHRLAGPAVVGLFALWLALCARHGMWRTRLIEGGLWAHLFIFATVFPLFWLTPPDERAMSRAGISSAGIPACSGMEWIRMALTGHSAGVHASAIAPEPWAGWLTAAAVAAAFVPAVFLLYRFLFYRRWAAGARERGARLLAAGGLFVALFGLGLIRALQATRWGPYYAWPDDGFPAWTAWAAGLAGLALWGARRGRPRLPRVAQCATPPWRAWAALAPWIALGVAGQALELRHELRLAVSDRALAAELPALPLYAMPARMMPYFGGALGGLGLLPASALGQGAEAMLAGLNPWPLLEAPEDTITWALAGAGRLSGKASKTALPIGPGLEFLRLEGLKPDLGRGHPRPTSGTLREVLPRDLWPGDGWDALEVGPQGEAWRWSRREDVRFRLPGLLPEGDYVVHIKGMRLGAPKGPARWTMRFHWDWPVYTVEAPEGWFEIAVPVRLSHIYRRCYLELSHPTARPSEAGSASGDTRRLGFLFLRLWVTKG